MKPRRNQSGRSRPMLWPEHHVDVRPVRGPVRIERPAIFDLDVRAQGDIGPVGPARPHARRTDRAPLLPKLRGERAHAVLVLDQDDAERPVEIALRPREERRRRAPHLLELPHQPSRRPLARVRDDGEVGALDLDPVVGGGDGGDRPDVEEETARCANEDLPQRDAMTTLTPPPPATSPTPSADTWSGSRTCSSPRQSCRP